MRPPIRVGIVDDCELVTWGLARMLEPFSDCVEVVAMDSHRVAGSNVDIILYDTVGQAPGTASDIRHLVEGAGCGRVVVYSWNVDHTLIEGAFASGAYGYVSKTATGAHLVKALERVHRGERVRPAIGKNENISGNVASWPSKGSASKPRGTSL